MQCARTERPSLGNSRQAADEGCILPGMAVRPAVMDETGSLLGAATAISAGVSCLSCILETAAVFQQSFTFGDLSIEPNLTGTHDLT